MSANILEEIIDAWRTQDLERFATYLPNDFILEVLVPDEFYPIGGLHEGKQAVIQRYARVVQDFQVVKVETIGLMQNADRAALQTPVQYRHRKSGMPLNTTIGCFWEIEDGWPVKLTQYHDIRRLSDFFRTLGEIR